MLDCPADKSKGMPRLSPLPASTADSKAIAQSSRRHCERLRAGTRTSRPKSNKTRLRNGCGMPRRVSPRWVAERRTRSRNKFYRMVTKTSPPPRPRPQRSVVLESPQTELIWRKQGIETIAEDARRHTNIKFDDGFGTSRQSAM